MSHGPFSIYSSKILKMVSPNGGEIITSDTLVITWISSGITNVNLDITRDMGLTWISIVSNIHSTGAYIWIGFSMNPPTSLARVRVTDSGDSTITDMSHDNFYIGSVSPLSLLSPINNNKFTSSSGMNISWKGIEIISSVKIEYSADNGRTWKIIDDNIPNTSKQVNNYMWNSIPQSIKGNILIRVSDSKGKYSDKSGKIIIN